MPRNNRLLAECLLFIFAAASTVHAFVGGVTRPTDKFARALTSTTLLRSTLGRRPTEQQGILETTDSLAPTITEQDVEETVSESLWKLNILQSAEYNEYLRTSRSAPALQKLFRDCQDAVKVQQSSIPNAGNGLFCSRDIPAGSIVTFYPVHAMGVQFADGDTFLCGESEEEYIDSEYVLSFLGNQAFQQLFPGSVVFFDAKSKVINPAWQAHCINDGSIIRENTGDAILHYYRDGLARQNTVFVPFGPTTVAVTTKDVEKGQELFTSYGQSYWLNAIEQDRSLWSSSGSTSSESNDEIRAMELVIAGLLTEVKLHVQDHYHQEERELCEAVGDIE